MKEKELGLQEESSTCCHGGKGGFVKENGIAEELEAP